ncbi:MAG: CRISPR-associated endonuclease Cas2 [Bryobacterales bacterium]|nr:CRISPR-associated endonuclease Cas2 [Bryobacteraceae bacterium]MDW8354307.1 CRISPR-associated endonuclease Cas2 [Bryobacterales bacterium]
MSWTEPRAHLIAYDIADPKRLYRVHRYLKTVAVDLQYSVFVGRLSSRQLDAILRELEDRIEPLEDDVRIYPLPERCQAVALGRQHLPDGVLLTDRALTELLLESLRRGEESSG